jgi:mannose-6-phosphate isomerase
MTIDEHPVADPVILGGLLKQYAWGAIDAMQPWTGTASGGPEAELWFGLHTSGRSPLMSAHDPADVATELLVKVLAASVPLSIQIHPDPQCIATLTDSGLTHLLADSREKIEMLIAVDDFDALAGLREPAEGSSVLMAMGKAREAQFFADGHVQECIRSLAAAGAMSDVGVESVLSCLSDDDRIVMEQVVNAFPRDPGLSIAFLMQPLRLQPGDALFVTSGVMHAYVAGLGVEVMTSSDDVLRLGLTAKEIAVEAALMALNTSRDVLCIRAEAGSQRYEAPTSPFTVERVVNGAASAPAGSTILAFDGPAVLTRTSDDGHGLPVTVPHGCAALAGRANWSVSTEGTSYVASPSVQD